MKYTLITGAGVNLGSFIAKKFASESHNIILTYLTHELEAKKLCEELNEKYNLNCITYKIDITKEEQVKELFNKYDVEILVNNASLSCDNDIKDKSFKEFMNVVSVNLGGTYLMCKYASKSNLIINISSRDSLDTYNPLSLDYCSSKAGINNLTKNLSLYYSDKKIYSVCPGWINTDNVKNMNPLYLESELKRIGQKKLLNAEYVADKIYELINSNLKSGSVVIIDEKE